MANKNFSSIFTILTSYFLFLSSRFKSPIGSNLKQHSQVGQAPHKEVVLSLWKYKIVTITALLAFVSGCSITPAPAPLIELGFEKILPTDKLKHVKNERIGIALAGGGTKAASFSMGVLSALANEPGLHNGADAMLWDVDVISTVSGGGYAAFFLYSKLIHDNELGQISTQKVQDYFEDCMPLSYIESKSYMDSKKSRNPKIFSNKLIPNIKFCSCKENENQKNYPYQQFLRGHQDVFNSTYSQNVISTIETVGQLTYEAVRTLPTVPVNLILTTLFDLPIHLQSPAGSDYFTGIGLAYGLYPIKPTDKSSGHKCNQDGFTLDHCVTDAHGSFSFRLKTEDFTFPKLEKLYKRNQLGSERNIPIWIINATAAQERGIKYWLHKATADMSRDIFHMSPFTQWSGRSGEIELDKQSLTILDAVYASAAFFDSNQEVLGQPKKFALAAAQHIFNLDWGIDIENPQADAKRRHRRLFLPTPLAWLDDYNNVAKPDPRKNVDPYIRLIDGGSSDGLGAYALITNGSSGGFSDVIISDHLQDEDGTMADLCFLRNELYVRDNLFLHIPGLANWRGACKHFAERSSQYKSDDCITPRKATDTVLAGSKSGNASYFYPVYAWPYPFLAGCVSDKPEENSCEDPSAFISRIWILKPAIDSRYFWENQEELEDGEDGEDVVKACNLMSDNTQNEWLLPCETSAFLINNATEKNGLGFTTFPQNSTISMTADSSSTLYGAYRDLAKDYTKKLLRHLRIAREYPEEFTRLVKWQTKNPIPSTLIKEKISSYAHNIFCIKIKSPHEHSICERNPKCQEYAQAHCRDVAIESWELSSRDRIRDLAPAMLPEN